MPKVYLMGFNHLTIFPTITDAATGYSSTDTDKFTVEGAYSCSPTENRNEFNIAADDDANWDSDSALESVDLSIVVRQLSLEHLAKLRGITIPSSGNLNGVYRETGDETTPTVGLSFSSLRRDGGYRLFKYFSAKLTGYQITHTTKGANGNNPEPQDVTLTFRCVKRKDGVALRDMQDVAANAALTWLDTLNDPTTPPAGGGV